MPFQKKPNICPICKQGKDFKFIRDFKKEENKFSLYECSKCQIQFWLPLKNPGNEWYEESGGYKIRNIIKPKIYRGYHKKFLETHKDFPKNTKVLDLGCGTGEFINELKERGCLVWGVDFDRGAIKTAKEYFKLENIFAMNFEDFFKKENLPEFDIICFFEIIEHLDNPLAFIRSVKDLLKTNGKFFLSTPYRERMLPNLNNWDFPPNHLTRWNEKALANLFRVYNFEITDISYIEQFKILAESINGKFKSGFVNKSLNFSENRKKFFILPKVVHCIGYLKYLLIGKIPAIFLWVLSKILKRKNGIMLIELKNEK